MRLSEFWDAVTDEFGVSYGRTLTHDLVLTEIGGMTADQAIASGRPPREVWIALCRACDVPADRWHGRREPRPV